MRRAMAPRAERAKRVGYASGRKVRAIKAGPRKTGPTPNDLRRHEGGQNHG